MFYKNKKYFAKLDMSTCVYFQGSVDAPLRETLNSEL